MKGLFFLLAFLVPFATGGASADDTQSRFASFERLALSMASESDVDTPLIVLNEVPRLQEVDNLWAIVFRPSIQPGFKWSLSVDLEFLNKRDRNEHRRAIADLISSRSLGHLTLGYKSEDPPWDSFRVERCIYFRMGEINYLSSYRKRFADYRDEQDFLANSDAKLLYLLWLRYGDPSKLKQI